MKRQAIDSHTQRIFAKDIFDKGQVLRKYKKLSKVNTYSSKTLLKIIEEGALPVHSMRPQSSRQQSETKTSHTHTHTHKLHANITDEHRCKNHQQNTSKLNPTIH